MSVAFFILVVLTLAGAVTAMSLRRLVHCALALAASLAGLAALYLELGAQFVGLAQILVYVGAVAILIVFAILLTGSTEEDSPRGFGPSHSPAAGVAIGAAVFAVLAWAICVHAAASPAALPAKPAAPVQQIGDALMGRFVLPLEVIALLLTAALIGAVILAMEEKHGAL
ncbi:MAG TPA: NADH-quinone oxidoreductase subunit J [Acidobacteriaceae bacterium]|jgi:NADH-quinone oxidoreductase subunit J|nr:NADH-quinone oxidoreductase subunit J [Acidobacteriaceae bacterium]